jgi:hypothetical protein
MEANSEQREASSKRVWNSDQPSLKRFVLTAADRQSLVANAC